ncbi:MAG: adenylate kinase [Chthonomonadetes bacterium]|nr:adenylate kinase [Chthonomonadetes bacterium]
MIWIFLGAPGAGKGTQAERLREDFGFVSVSTGEMLREAMRAGSELGKTVQEYVTRGDLVPDDLVAAVLRERLAQGNTGNGVILDGFPRTVRQAEILEEMLAKHCWQLCGVLYLEASEEVVLQRLGGRRNCPQCGANYHVVTMPPKVEGVCDRCGAELVIRPDDAPEAIRKRLEVYHQQTKPLIAFYDQRGILERIDASGEVDEVYQAVKDAVSRRWQKCLAGE